MVIDWSVRFDLGPTLTDQFFDSSSLDSLRKLTFVHQTASHFTYFIYCCVGRPDGSRPGRRRSWKGRRASSRRLSSTRRTNNKDDDDNNRKSTCLCAVLLLQPFCFLQPFFVVFSARQRLSVRPSHGWILQRWFKLGLWNFHYTIAPCL